MVLLLSVSPPPITSFGVVPLRLAHFIRVLPFDFIIGAPAHHIVNDTAIGAAMATLLVINTANKPTPQAGTPTCVTANPTNAPKPTTTSPPSLFPRPTLSPVPRGR